MKIIKRVLKAVVYTWAVLSFLYLVVLQILISLFGDPTAFNFNAPKHIQIQKTIFEHNSGRSFTGDGYTLIVFETKPQTLDDFLKQEQNYNGYGWVRGPIKDSFLIQAIRLASVGVRDLDRKDLFPVEEWQVSSRILFYFEYMRAYEARGPSDVNLIVYDPDNNRLYYLNMNT
jgi:hypothetical protein